MPLQQAIYVGGSTDKIFAVRGQWVFQYNATTGLKEREFRFANEYLFSESSIINYAANLYIGTWRRFHNPNVAPREFGDIYEVNLALTTSTPLGLSATVTGAGFSNLVTDGAGVIWGLEGYGRTAAGKAFRYDIVLDNFTEFTTGNPFGEPHPICDAEYDSDNSVMWVAESISPDLVGYSAGAAGVSGICATTPPYIIGLTRYQPTGKIYCVCANQDIVRINADTAVVGLPGAWNTSTWGTFSTLLDAGATPIKIKYNAHENLIYVPEWNNDTVQTLNGVTGALVGRQTGFNKPIDCVFQTLSPFKKWAVQNSSVGLKEITI